MTLVQVLTKHDPTLLWAESGTPCTSAILVRYICILGQMFSAFSRQEPYDAAKKSLMGSILKYAKKIKPKMEHDIFSLFL
jgi:hypothetical protein